MAVIRPNAVTTWEMVSECEVQMMLDSGLPISLIYKIVAAAFSTEYNKYNTISFGLKLVLASDGNIPALGSMTL